MKRFNVEIPDDRADDLKEMMDDMGIRTYKDLFDNAMTITKWMIRQRKKGDSIGSYSSEEDTFRELVMPCIEFIKKSE